VSDPEPDPPVPGADPPDPAAAAGTPPDPAAAEDAADTPDAGPPAGRSGPELARAVLDAAMARRGAGGRSRGGARGGSGGGRSGAGGAAGRRGRRREWSGPGPDPRDPQPFGAVLGKLVKARGWQRPAAEATLFGQWEKVVGGEVADHCRPVKLENGELTIEAESTAWATQLRLLAGSLIKQIAAAIGHNLVTRLRVHGPAAPSWQRGGRRVRGRGPRDTYG